MAHRYKVIQGGPYPHLITCTVVNWLPAFVSGRYCRVLVNSLQHVREHRDVALHAYVMMPTHFHAIMTARNDDLSAVMRDLKKFTSRELYAAAETEGNRLFTWMFDHAAKSDQRSRFKIWQDEFHPKAITSSSMFLQKAEYIHMNPVRRELVIDAEKWYYSSASAYAGGEIGPLQIDMIEF